MTKQAGRTALKGDEQKNVTEYNGEMVTVLTGEQKERDFSAAREALADMQRTSAWPHRRIGRIRTHLSSAFHANVACRSRE